MAAFFAGIKPPINVKITLKPINMKALLIGYLAFIVVVSVNE